MADMIDTDAMQAEVDGLTTSINNVLQLKVDLQNWLNQAAEAVHYGTLSLPSLAKLDEIVSWLSDQKPPMQARLNLAYAVAAATVPGFVVGGMPGHGVTVPVDLDWIDKTQSLVTAANSGSLTAAQWAQIEQLSTNKDYAAWFGATFYNQVSPDRLSALVQGESDHEQQVVTVEQWNAYQSQGGSLSYDEWSKQQLDDYQAKVTALGDLLGDASQPGFPSLRTDYADDVVQVFKESATDATVSPAALSLVLSSGTYSYAFATTVANGVYNYETSPGFSGWGSVAGGTSAQVLAPDGGMLTDPMGGVLTMLSSNAKASQDFFTNGGTVQITVQGQTNPNGEKVEPDQTVSVNSRLEYLSVDRSWGAGSDQGDGLGKALEAATTTYRNQESTGQMSAEIATQVFAVEGQSQKVADSMPENMKDSVAAIIADYSSDVMRICYDNGSSDPLADGYYHGDYDGMFPPGMSTGVLMDKSAMENVFHGLGRGPNSDQNLETVLTGWAAAETVTANYETSNHPFDTVKRDNAIKDDASVLKFITNNAVEGADADKAAQEEKAKLINDALSIASAIPILKAPAAIGEWGKWIWDQSLDQAKDAVKDGVTSAASSGNAATQLQDNRTSAENQMVKIWFNAALNNGGVSPEAIKAGLAPTYDGGGNPAPSPIYVDDGAYHVDPSSPGFKGWIENNTVPWGDIEALIETGVLW